MAISYFYKTHVHASLLTFTLNKNYINYFYNYTNSFVKTVQFKLLIK